jgi:hypothetical protein
MKFNVFLHSDATMCYSNKRTAKEALKEFLRKDMNLGIEKDNIRWNYWVKNRKTNRITYFRVFDINYENMIKDAKEYAGVL